MDLTSDNMSTTCSLHNAQFLRKNCWPPFDKMPCAGRFYPTEMVSSQTDANTHEPATKSQRDWHRHSKDWISGFYLFGYFFHKTARCTNGRKHGLAFCAGREKKAVDCLFGRLYGQHWLCVWSTARLSFPLKSRLQTVPMVARLWQLPLQWMVASLWAFFLQQYQMPHLGGSPKEGTSAIRDNALRCSFHCNVASLAPNFPSFLKVFDVVAGLYGTEWTPTLEIFFPDFGAAGMQSVEKAATYI